MKDRFHVDPEKVVVGSALRRARHMIFDSTVTYHTDIPLALNNIILGEMVRVPASNDRELNWTERIYPGSSDGSVRITSEELQEGLFVGVLGNRYAPPYLIGGLTHPIDGCERSRKGEEPLYSLFGANCIGWFDQGPPEDERSIVRLLGTLVDDLGDPISLRRFKEKLSRRKVADGNHAVQVPLIVIGGYCTNSGKSTCARALARGLRRRGFRVTIEKKTGTACCRDWISCLETSDAPSILEPNPAIPLEFDPDHSDGRDFVDGLGVVSDVSLDAIRFTSESARYTLHLLEGWKPDFHIVELADGLCHQRNWSLLQHPEFTRLITCFVYNPHPSFEAAAHFLFFLRNELKLSDPVLFSGPVANEDDYRIVREEISFRLRTPVCRSAVFRDQQWIPFSEDLADHVCRVHESHTSGSAEQRN